MLIPFALGYICMEIWRWYCTESNPGDDNAGEHPEQDPRAATRAKPEVARIDDSDDPEHKPPVKVEADHQDDSARTKEAPLRRRTRR